MKDVEKSKEQLFTEIDELKCEIARLNARQMQYEELKKEFLKQKRLLQGIARAKQCLLTITDPEKAISEVLRILCKSTGVDSIDIFENHYSGEKSRVTYSHRFRWDVKNKEIQMNIAGMQNMEYGLKTGAHKWFNILSSGKAYCSLIKDFPSEEKIHLERQGIISIMFVPILIGDKFWGFISFEDCHSERIWTESEKSLLTAMASGLGGALSRRESEKALSEEKERLSVTLKSIGEGVITTDTEGRITLMNRAAEELTGWTQEEAFLKPIEEVFRIMDEKTRKIYKNSLKKALKPRLINNPDNWSHTILIDRKGNEKAISDTGALILDESNNVIGNVVVFRDITEKLKMEEELIRMGKIESIGILAGGIAHDFNNILTIMMGNVSLAIMYIKNGNREKALNRLYDIEKASHQVKDLTMQLLTLSKGTPLCIKTICVEELLKDTVNFALNGSNILCEFSFPDDLWAVEADEGQISQVINNIVINAKQAMPKGGIIRIGACNIISDQEQGVALKYGKYVKLYIEDTGIGIPEEIMSKIFDPYFTTKPNGSGLGLSTSYSIIKKHNGHITVKSKTGEGTVFYIYLPASENKVIRKKDDEEIFMQKGKILIMDDEESIREIVGAMLNLLGYEAYFASDGQEALKLYSCHMDNGEKFDAVIMDLSISGGMGGKETIGKLLNIDPDSVAIVSSGYSNDPVMINYKEYGFCGSIAKPFKIRELGRILYQAVNQKLGKKKVADF